MMFDHVVLGRAQDGSLKSFEEYDGKLTFLKSSTHACQKGLRAGSGVREVNLCIDGGGLSIRAGPLIHHVPACRYLDASPNLCMRAIGFNMSATMTCVRVNRTLR